MTTEKMLQEIQEKIGDKKLRPGYIYENLGYRQEILLEHETEDDILYDIRDTQTNEIVRINRNTILLATNHNIGHPVMIGDVLEYLDDKGKGLGINQRYNDYGHTEIYSDGLDTIELICAWKDFKKPIIDQSPETIKSIWEIVCK